MDWQILLYLLAGGLLVWLIFRMVRHNPESFSRAALSKSVFTLGFLALMLIGLIFLCVLFLKNSI